MSDPSTSDPTQRLNDLAISDRGFVFDPDTGVTYTLNATGLVILRAFKAANSLADTVRALREAFEVPDDMDLERDVLEFVGRMRSQGLLPENFELS